MVYSTKFLYIILFVVAASVVSSCATPQDIKIETIESASLPPNELQGIIKSLEYVRSLPLERAKGDFPRQVFSVFGREDIALKEASFLPCKSFKNALRLPLNDTEKINEFFQNALNMSSVLIIGEDHITSSHREFVRVLLDTVDPDTFDWMFVETLLPDKSPYFSSNGEIYEEVGFYNHEPTFSTLLETANKIGITIISHEQTTEQRNKNIGPRGSKERINAREKDMAKNISKAMNDNETIKTALVFGGNGHGDKSNNGNVKWMANRLGDLVGNESIVSIRQSNCKSEIISDRYAVYVLNDLSNYDFHVIHPTGSFKNSRPGWRSTAGYKDTPIRIAPLSNWTVFEARRSTETVHNTPTDRALVRPGEENNVSLSLPPGKYRLNSIEILPPLEESR